jgi:hypothetical protein
MKKIILLFICYSIHYYCFSQIKTVVDKSTKPLKLSSIATNTYNFSNTRVCIDNPPPSSPLPPRAATNAYTIYKIDADGNIGKVAFQRQPLAAITDKMWEPGETLKVGFNIQGGSITLIDKVKFYCKEWERIANIKFEFVTNISTAVIRVGFLPGGSYSWIGREALSIPNNVTTMNFGWLIGLSDALTRQVVLHEFGHALGFIHEHQSPGVAIPWDKEKVYAFYAQPPNNWTREYVDQNIFARFATTQTNYSYYDKLSIMQYAISPDLTTDGSSIAPNMDFSNIDKQYSALIYPFPPSPPTATGALKTGDDCDRVDFRIEYNAVASDKIEFVFELGALNNKKVTWWKQIGIPLTNNTEYLIAIQNHSLIASENKTSAIVPLSFNNIDKQKSIRFWKAKFLGVHTLLGYQWNILPALRGGCRVYLKWNRDSCAP